MRRHGLCAAPTRNFVWRDTRAREAHGAPTNSTANRQQTHIVGRPELHAFATYFYGDASTIDNFLGRVVRESWCTAVMRITDRGVFAKSKSKRFVASVASTAGGAEVTREKGDTMAKKKATKKAPKAKGK
jgi:hypothetical protein